ncbi:GL16913 [Drosophila persimilis]|uniref:GL16913 n=1 Tax=Drosophila persimilis TaxID=7234 RepID=B4GHN2_DROPE|nr:GL16913 [Drosophila persimilis]
MPQTFQLLLWMGMLMPLMLLQLGQGHAATDLESATVAGAQGTVTAVGSPRNRLKAEAETLMAAGDSFNIRHGRSRTSHMLHNTNINSDGNSNNSGTSGSGSASISMRPTLVTPTQQPGAGGTTSAPVTHKIRKLHKKKINESIRKSVDKSLGVLHLAKNHRSLAEAEHLQGRPTYDEDTAALSEVMELADEIDLENSLQSAYQNVVVGLTATTTPFPTPQPPPAPTPPAAVGVSSVAKTTPTRGTGTGTGAADGALQLRQFVRANIDDANYAEDEARMEDFPEVEVDLDEDEEEPLSTTSMPKMGIFAPHHVTASATRTRLLPVNSSSWQEPLDGGGGVGDIEVRSGDSTESDYRLDDSHSGSENDAFNNDDNIVDDDDNDDVDVDEENTQKKQSYARLPFEELQLLNDSGSSTTEWMDDGNRNANENDNSPGVEARSQANMEVKQIHFGGEGESDSVLDTSEVTMDDGYPPEVQIDDNTKQLVIEDVEGNDDDTDGENMESNQLTADVINARDSKIDLVSKFLQYIEQQHLMGSNCVAGTSLNLGEGVVDRYAQDRFRVEAEVAVNRANMLTR